VVPLSFSAAIHKLGINPVIDVPADVVNALFHSAGRARGPIAVRGTINAAEFTQTLVKTNGVWRLYVNAGMRRSSGLSVGDTAEVSIVYDDRPREVPMPQRLRESLDLDPEIARAFAQLKPSRRREILLYLNSLKTEQAVDRVIVKVLEQLRHLSASKPGGA
jgi:hypothetical protein